jgi:6-phosphogluconolactonase
MRFAAFLLMLSAQAWGASVSGYIGTYTSHNGAGNGSKGIYSFQWDPKTGSLTDMRAAGIATNPSFLVLHPNGRLLYAVNEGGPTDADRITAFAVSDSNSSGQLRDLGSVSSMGKGPCHLSLDSSGRWLFVANYGSGSIAVYPVQPDGILGDARQTIQQQDPAAADESPKRPHAHEVVPSPDDRFLLSVDLGLDKVFIYRFDAVSGTLTANDPAALQFPSKYGPRHLIFSKDARRVYLLTELTAKLVTLGWDAARGSLIQLAETSALPPGYAGQPSGAELALSRDGRFLYASNRAQSNTITAFRIGPDGLPAVIGSIESGGQTPRFIVIDPSDRFVLAANQDSNNIAVFRIDPVSGALNRQPGQSSLPAPVDIVFQHHTIH